MSFEQSGFGSGAESATNSSDPETNAEKPKNLEEYLKAISKELADLKIPVTEDCRIEMKDKVFQNFPNVEKDINEVISREKKWEKEKPKRSKNEKGAGEQMEMFKTALFHKCLGKDYCVLRSSKIDDYDHGIDNVIIEKKTGTIVGAIDEVVANEESGHFSEKENKVRSLNSMGKGFLKYCFDMKDGKILSFGQKIHIPVFYLALSNAELFKAIKNFDFSANFSDEEINALEKLTASISEQIQYLSKNSPGFIRNQVPSLEKFNKALQDAPKSKPAKA